MKIGPFTIAERLDGVIHPGFVKTSEVEQKAVCQNFENFWQYSKIYSVDVVDNIVQQSFFTRRAEGFASVKAKRRVFPKKSGVTTLAAYYNGQLYDYQNSRFFYCSYYSLLIENHPTFIELRDLINSGVNVIILDYDSPGVDSHLSVLTPEYFKREYYDISHPFGHGMVICGLLLNIKPWMK